jgi:UDP-N-acetylmuramoyl-L-alanyl-D-glutamate--2,6-diaminopimelate ligase
MEASSHGLAQYRIDGVRFSAAGFTNVSRDHLDYHESFEDYLAQKLRLFTEVLASDGTAVVNADSCHAKTIIEAARARGLACLTVGERGEALKLAAHARVDLGQALTVVDAQGGEHGVTLPLVGDFQTSNALVAAGLAIATGIPAGEAVAGLNTLEGAKGRLEKVGETPTGAAIFVDYAHTPDALKTVLQTLRPYTRRRLIVVFGAGGDRDKGKRPLMGKIAADLADIAIVTDDNPRSEDAAAIRADILATAPEAIEIGDRRTAVAAGVRMLRAGDVLLVAGKGHEAGQIVGDEVIPFSDHDAVVAAVEQVGARG